MKKWRLDSRAWQNLLWVVALLLPYAGNLTDVRAQEVCRSLNLPIPDNGQVTDTITITETEVIDDLNVYLDVSHTWVGDLTVTLANEETGTSVVLIDRPGTSDPGSDRGCREDDIDAVLDDSEGDAVEDQCNVGGTAIQGSFSPNNPLNLFDGESVTGTWSLIIVDGAGIDTGTFKNWCLRFAADSDDDGKLDREDNCPDDSNPTQADGDADGAGDACDTCLSDPLKTAPGTCGCGKPDVDIENDGAIDCALSNPASSMLSRYGVLLIPESTNDRVMAFDPKNGNPVDLDFIPSDSVNLHTPICAVLNAEQDGVLISDQFKDAVLQYDLDGNFVGLFAPKGGVDSSVLDNGRGITLQDNGTLLVAVAGTNTATIKNDLDAVSSFSSEGVFTKFQIAKGAGGLDSPFDLLIRGSELLVGGVTSNKIHRYQLSDGAYLDDFAAVNGFPEQLHSSSNGNLLVANFSGLQEGILEYASDGTLLGRYRPFGVDRHRGVYQLAGGTLLVATADGVFEISRSGQLIRTVVKGVSARFIELVIIDADGDGTGDSLDQCPIDANKINPGICGCGVLEEAVDTDSDGTLDCLDTDDDGDGLSDDDEKARFTDRLDPDTDDDGVLDGQEVSDGSNPRDRGSLIAVLPTMLCAEWNGFLGGMWNVMEHVNMSSQELAIESTLFALDGTTGGAENFSVLPRTQFDLLVHDMDSWALNSYGRVCSAVTGGSPGDVDGRMVYYREAAGSLPPDYSFQFAFAMPFLKGTKGRQVVTFNTYQPSQDPVDAGNLVVNWVQISNLEDSIQTGTLNFYAYDGSLLGAVSVALAAGARNDYSGHRFGVNLVGVAEWVPDDLDAAFHLRNARYFYDNPGWTNSFVSAFQLAGAVGSGELLVAPLDTTSGSAILEVANSLPVETAVTVNIYDSSGAFVVTQDFLLAAYASVHVIADSYLFGEQGIATIDGAQFSSIVATAMHYGRTASGGIQFLYGFPARQSLGTTLRSSYNTFLGQECRLLLVNSSDSAVSVAVSMRRYDGTDVLLGSNLEVPGLGLYDFDLCANDEADNYGVVTLQPDAGNTITGDVLRLGRGDQYRFPIPARQ